MFADLAANVGVLLALAVVHGVLGFRRYRGDGLVRELTAGLMLGLITLVLMTASWEVSQGIIFDARSVAIALGGLFFGLVPVTVAALLVAAYRVALGGSGLDMGIAVIVVSAGVGLVWRLRWRRVQALSLAELYGFGIVAAVGMLACTVFLPAWVRLQALRAMAIPVLLAYPVATALVAWLIQHLQRQREDGDALSFAAERWRLAFATSPDAINLTRLSDGRCVDVNAGFTKLTGYTREEAIGRTSLELGLWVEHRDREKMVARLREDGVCESYEAPFRAKDGHVMTGLLSGTVVSMDREPHILSIIRDISRRKASEVELRRAYDRLLRAQRLGRVGFLDWELSTGKIQWSEETARMYGMPENTLDQTIEATVAPLHPDDKERVHEALERAIRGEAEYDVIHRLVRGDGSIIWVHAQAELERDEEGVPTRLLGTIVDVTDLQEAAEELRRSRERYRSFFDQDISGDYVVLADGRLVDCNPAFLEIFGFESLEQALATSMEVLYPDPARRAHLVEQVRQAREIRGHEGEYRRLDGREVHVIENAVGIFDDDGKLYGLRGFVMDVTERQELEAQLRQAQKMDAVGRLAGGIAHDFNNLLQALGGVADVLALDAESERVRALAGEISTQVRRGSGLTRQLLLFARREVSRREPSDLRDVLDHAETFFGRLLPANVRLELRVPPESLPVFADRGQIDQVLVNLAVNARDAMPQGGTLRLTAGRDGDEVWFEVTDDGVGIPRDTLDVIFDPFFTTKGAEQGTGLGLAVVHGIVRDHGGRVQVNSRPGSGSTFRVYLPLSQGPTVAATNVPEAADSLYGHGERVLLVEDDQHVREPLKKVLRRLGYVVETADSAEEALTLPEEPRPDVLLSDVMLSGMSGVELARHIDERWPGLAVVLMSGYGADEVVGGGLDVKRFTFLQKPVTMQELSSALRRSMHEREAR